MTSNAIDVVLLWIKSSRGLTKLNFDARVKENDGSIPTVGGDECKNIIDI